MKAVLKEAKPRMVALSIITARPLRVNYQRLPNTAAAPTELNFVLPSHSHSKKPCLRYRLGFGQARIEYAYRFAECEYEYECECECEHECTKLRNYENSMNGMP